MNVNIFVSVLSYFDSGRTQHTLKQNNNHVKMDYLLKVDAYTMNDLTNTNNE